MTLQCSDQYLVLGLWDKIFGLFVREFSWSFLFSSQKSEGSKENYFSLSYHYKFSIHIYPFLIENYHPIDSPSLNTREYTRIKDKTKLRAWSCISIQYNKYFALSPIKQIQGGSNMTGTNCDLFTYNQSRSYLNHLVITIRGASSFLFLCLVLSDG